MGGQHRRPRPRWHTALLLGGLAGAGAAMGYYEHPAPHHPAATPGSAVSQAQRLGQDIVGQCSVNPASLSTQICGDAEQVADTQMPGPGKDGHDGLDGQPGRDGANGRNGKDGSTATLMIFTFPDGTSYGCPRDGGTDLEPVYKCKAVKLVDQK